MELPHSPACERNKDVIAETLKDWVPNYAKNFLEVGFGTGQHAYHFAPLFSDLAYHAADQENYHPILELRRKNIEPPQNLEGPFLFYADEAENCVRHNLPNKQYDFIFTANTLHIMSWPEGLLALKEVANLLANQGTLLIYGPFTFEGKFTSESNATFDQSLRARDPRMGIRAYEEVAKVLLREGLSEKKILTMPANNNILAFQKT